ncbi:Cysteine-rich CPXCG [Marinospirillum celere]|uniref:Cysteine-rich CPXCG n=1 Tax=Marinospirillum celere TaxID=1122252 RepID=A0A1I1HX38_9GAMM|nr:CPXCG motif-containing cysteine-rich protein [Marinospirillum celere]SFC28345.1 Cysteine-rich CPXCG [Marinospirillum celere]
MNEAMLTSVKDTCPYCGSDLELAVDISSGSQEFIEDCEVCCAPITIVTEVDLSGHLLSTQLKRESD